MNKEQIKDLIASKIAGQGSAVDAGSALPEILNAIIDSIPEGGGSGTVIKLEPNESLLAPYYNVEAKGFYNIPFNTYLQALGITSKEFDIILKGRCILQVGGTQYPFPGYVYEETSEAPDAATYSEMFPFFEGPNRRLSLMSVKFSTADNWETGNLSFGSGEIDFTEQQ